MVNLLVCRIRMRVEPDRAAKLLLEMLKPKTMTIAQKIMRTTGGRLEFSEVYADVQSQVIEILLCKYDLGELLRPLGWLFAEPNGAMTRWTLRYANEKRKQFVVMMSYDSGPRLSDAAGSTWDMETSIRVMNSAVTGGKIRSSPLGTTEIEVDDGTQARYQDMVAVLDDGVTLDTTEYRILKFYFDNGREDWAMPIKGLRRYASRRFRVASSQVPTIYHAASQRIIDAMGEGPAQMAKRGVTPPPESARRRRRWRMRLSNPSDHLSQPEIKAILAMRRERNKPAVHDIAWALGVTPDAIYRVQRRASEARREKGNRES